MVATATPELQRIRVEHEECRERRMKQLEKRTEICKKNLFGHKNKPKRSDENVGEVAAQKENAQSKEKGSKQLKSRKACKKNLSGHKKRPTRSDENVGEVAAKKENAQRKEKRSKQLKSRKACKKNLTGQKNRPRRSDENVAGSATQKEHVRSRENGSKKNLTGFSKQSVPRSKPRPWPNFTNSETTKLIRKPTWLLNYRPKQSTALQHSDAASSQVSNFM